MIAPFIYCPVRVKYAALQGATSSSFHLLLLAACNVTTQYIAQDITGSQVHLVFLSIYKFFKMTYMQELYVKR